MQCLAYFNLLLPTGCELNKEKKEYNWDSEDEELSKTDIEQKLVLSQVRELQCYRMQLRMLVFD